jgi:hypothetical protein
MNARTQAAVDTFTARTGIKPSGARAMSGSMKDHVCIKLKEHTEASLTALGMTNEPYVRREFRGVFIRFIHDDCPWKDTPGVALNIEWTALEA